MDKGKKPANSGVVKRPNLVYTPYGIRDLDHENSTMKDILTQEAVAWRNKEREKDQLKRKMRRMKMKMEKEGKDWVESEEESKSFGLFNIELIDECIAASEKRNTDLKAGKISEEEFNRQEENEHEYYTNKHEELLDADNAEIASLVQRYEAAKKCQSSK